MKGSEGIESRQCQAVLAKRELRIKLSESRAEDGPQLQAHCNGLVCNHIRDFIVQHLLSRVLLFSSIRGEPNILDLSRNGAPGMQSCHFALPVVQNKKDMNFYSWSYGEPLFRSALGIMEPNPRQSQVFAVDKNTLVLVPALAVDRDGNRLGYGGGFYDRFLARHPEISTMAVLWSDYVLSSKIPKNSWDIAMQWVATEDGVIKL